jgi:hypothetical protein
MEAMEKYSAQDHEPRIEIIPWEYEGRIVPMTVYWPAPEQEAEMIELIADFLWNHLHDNPDQKATSPKEE